MNNNWQKAEEILKNDGLSAMSAHAGQAGVVVLPTDTLYGIVGRALSRKAVERIYKIKGRNESKPFIVLITSYKHLDLFGIKLEEEQAKFLEKIWPGKVSVILPCLLNKWRFIHRGTKSIAFRMIGPKNINVFNLINKVGPLVAPSANNEDGKPAETIKEAQNYFRDEVDFYINGGERKLNPSTLIKLENNNFVILRQGEKKIEA